MNAAAAPPQRVVIAGVAGGVGTTTVAALLFASFGTLEAPQLLDHSGGELGLRLTGGDDVLTVMPALALHDLGPHALTRGIDALEDPRAMLLAVTGGTPGGLAVGGQLLAEVKERFALPGLSRCVVVPVGVFGNRRILTPIDDLMRTYGRRSVMPLPRDPALTGGGRIPVNRLSAETRRAQARLFDLVTDRLAGNLRPGDH